MTKIKMEVSKGDKYYAMLTNVQPVEIRVVFE